MQKLLYTVVHLLFWTTFTALSWMAISTNPGETAFMLNNPSASWLLGAWALFNFYSFYGYAQPAFLDSGKYVTYFLISVCFSVVSSAVFVGFFWMLFESFRPYAFQKFVEGIAGTFLISQCGSLLKGFISWNQNLHLKTELENKSLKNELSMLKAQLSPHFLFNTLNNIDSLIYKSQDEASAMLIRLSELLRYMLYDSDSKEVSIEREIEYVQQLTDLQKLRFEDDNFIALNIDNQNPDFRIAPLLLLPFVENAFKFVSNPKELPAIKMSITVGSSEVKFYCENYFDRKLQESKNPTGGIGLLNVRRRLDLLYPNRFNLSIDQLDEKYIVELRLTAK